MNKSTNTRDISHIFFWHTILNQLIFFCHLFFVVIKFFSRSSFSLNPTIQSCHEHILLPNHLFNKQKKRKETIRTSVCIILENMQKFLLYKFFFYLQSIQCVENTSIPYFCSRQIYFDDVLLICIDWFSIFNRSHSNQMSYQPGAYPFSGLKNFVYQLLQFKINQFTNHR